MQVRRLYEVDIARLVLIVLLLTYHSFAIYCGKWEKLDGQPDIDVYNWIGLFAYSFFLEMFVFISGYVLGYKMLLSGSSINYGKEIKKKVMRLLVPSIIFSSIYYVCFYDLRKPLHEVLYTIADGCGHLWFLPMLFWCFIFYYLVEYLKLDKIVVLMGALLMSLLSFMPLPLRINTAFYYFLFFYVGYFVSRNQVNLQKIISVKSILLISVLYLVIFVSSKLTVVSPLEGGAIYHASEIILGGVVKIMYAFAGMTFTFFLILKLQNRKENSILPPTLSFLPSYCFGVYIYQQFVLIILYRYLPSCVSYEWLPWCGLVVTAIISITLTFITLKLPYGKKLIG